MEWIITLLALLYAVAFIWNVLADSRNNRFFSAYSLTVLTILFIIIALSYENRNKPTAMDVYQGKTTLEITYRNNIPVDSVVVFKDEFKK